MTIEKLPRWCTTSTNRKEPSGGIKTAGYTPAAQPAAYNWNWLVGTAIDKINELNEDCPSGFQSDQGFGPLIKRYYPLDGETSWSQIHDYVNRVAGGSGKAYVGLCFWVDTSKAEGLQKKILALDSSTDRQIDVIDVATMTVESNSGDLGGANLPSGSGETWIPLSFCCDGTSVYVVFQDTNASPEEYRIQAYNCQTWVAKAGWAATGTALAGTGALPQNYIYGDCQVVTDTLIAVSHPWTTIVGAATAAISVIGMSDGVVDNYGAGDGTGNYADRLTSDGTYIYYTNPAGYEINSCEIADPTAGCGGTNWPLSSTASGVPIDVLAIGELIVSSWGGGRIWTSTVGEGEISYSASGDDRIINRPGSLSFDGLHIWTHCDIDVTVTNTKTGAAKIDISGHSYDAAGTLSVGPALETITRTSMIANMAANSTSYYHIMGRMTFDGSSIWFIGDMRASQTLSGIIYRIPRAVIR